jgi:molybdopterin/thiamine biosynthesis adenylyltransferase
VTSLAQENHPHKPAAPTDVHTNDRYSRQILFRGIGTEGQARLARSQVAIVGCGATGSALAALLGRAGVGTLRIIDRDYVEPSNLQRQSLFDEQDASESLPARLPPSTRRLWSNRR